jgi:phosphatidate phosphatase APP1
MEAQMSDAHDWRRALLRIASDVEAQFDALKYRLDERLGRGPLQIVAYDGYGTADMLMLRGRVLEDAGIRPADDRDGVWENLANMYRRFASDEIPFARVAATFGAARCEAQADEEGFFTIALAPAAPLPADRLWHTIQLELLHPQAPDGRPVTASGRVLVPPPTARFGVISDIDDTIVHTDALHPLRMARTVFLGNALTRLPFEGVAEFYTALQRDSAGALANPIFYVSSSPWNMYDLLADFLVLHGIPRGPLLLRDWGLTPTELLPTDHHAHKQSAIRTILARYPHLPFILIGDDGQQDPEIYTAAAEAHPGRILAIYIRSVDTRAERAADIATLAARCAAAGVPLIAGDTAAMAGHFGAQL